MPERMADPGAAGTTFGTFQGTLPASLRPEDLNPHHVLFELRDARSVLSGSLDFESTWAGLGESDLARLQALAADCGRAVRDGYREVAMLSGARASMTCGVQALEAEPVPDRPGRDAGSLDDLGDRQGGDRGPVHVASG